MALGELKNGIGPDAYAIYQQVLAAAVERDHPVGSLYISETPTSPAELYGGTWERIENCTIWGASDTHPAGTKLEAGLPNIKGGYDPSWGSYLWRKGSNSGAFGEPHGGTHEHFFNSYVDDHSAVTATAGLAFDASLSNPIYGASTTVQPPAYCTYIWRRVA